MDGDPILDEQGEESGRRNTDSYGLGERSVSSWVERLLADKHVSKFMVIE